MRNTKTQPCSCQLPDPTTGPGKRAVDVDPALTIPENLALQALKFWRRLFAGRKLIFADEGAMMTGRRVTQRMRGAK